MVPELLPLRAPGTSADDVVVYGVLASHLALMPPLLTTLKLPSSIGHDPVVLTWVLAVTAVCSWQLTTRALRAATTVPSAIFGTLVVGALLGAAGGVVSAVGAGLYVGGGYGLLIGLFASILACIVSVPAGAMAAALAVVPIAYAAHGRRFVDGSVRTCFAAAGVAWASGLAAACTEAQTGPWLGFVAIAVGTWAALRGVAIHRHQRGFVASLAQGQLEDLRLEPATDASLAPYLRPRDRTAATHVIVVPRPAPQDTPYRSEPTVWTPVARIQLPSP